MTSEKAAGNRTQVESTDLQRIAEQIFGLQLMFWSVRHKNRTDDPNDLTEPEFMTLDTLIQQGKCTVGALQKVLDVQPAQMSRIIRSLESKNNKKLVECELNPDDKRRIDVSISAQGKRAHEEYRKLRLQAQRQLLVGLSEEEQSELLKLLSRFRQIMSEQLGRDE